MSYTEIFMFGRDGNAAMVAEVKNAWRGAMAIWKYLEEKHLPLFRPGYVPAYIPDSMVEAYCHFKPSRLIHFFKDDQSKEIWNLADNMDVPEHERIVLYTTFDRCLVRKENLPAVIDAFRKFEGVTSLPEQANILERFMQDENCIAVGWNQTSVNGDTWGNFNYDAETDEMTPYNCLTQHEHHWVFDVLKRTPEQEGSDV